jgi:hypothetical protein
MRKGRFIIEEILFGFENAEYLNWFFAFYWRRPLSDLLRSGYEDASPSVVRYVSVVE